MRIYQASRTRRANRPLILGGLIVLVLVFLAYAGPSFVPQDPMQENYSLAVDGQIVRPPYPPLKLPGYPLGTDQFGRDILSRLIWGIRPTLTMVSTVAAVRLVLGILLGLVIGWSSGVRGRVTEAVLSAALSIPVLLVALMGISVVGIQSGLFAFIFGLSLTGWAETARLVSDQTRILKGQVFVEAARALGASDARILFRHVLKQIMPLIWMLLAFEVSATLLLVAELGFMGYYIGGGVWIEVFDFVSVNATGAPELGQMLSTALQTLVKPWVLIITGTVIFFAILGFNLLGEGLRLRVQRETDLGVQRPFFLRGQLGDWLAYQVLPSIDDWVERNALRLGLAAGVVLLVGGWTIWWGNQPKEIPSFEVRTLSVPGDHLWASDRHDAQGTLWTAAHGPREGNILWKFIGSGGLNAGPVVAADGTLYLSSRDTLLYAVDPQGKELWRVELPAPPVGAPALGPDGQVYVSDQIGGLAAFEPGGNRLWWFRPTRGREATSGPVVASDGTVYYTRVDHIQAVSPTGDDLWLGFAVDAYVEAAPMLSAGESFIFLRDAALAANSGAPLALDGMPADEPEFNTPTYLVGAEGNSYFRSGHEIFDWRSTEEGIERGRVKTWDHNTTVPSAPTDQGITPNGQVWFFYSTSYIDTRIVWMDVDGATVGATRLPKRDGRVLGVDARNWLYICHSNFGINFECGAVEPGADEPVWNLDLGQDTVYVGGALVDGRIYVATSNGELTAIGESP